MRVDEKLNRMVQVCTALCAGLANSGGSPKDGVCSFRLASRGHGISPESSVHSVQVAFRQGRVEISLSTSGSTTCAVQAGKVTDAVTLRFMEDGAANSLELNKTSALLRVTNTDSDCILADTMVEWTFDQIFPSDCNSNRQADCTLADTTFSSVWSWTVQPRTSPTAHTLSLQVCCISGDGAISQIQCRIHIAADQKESAAILSEMANGRTGQFVVALTTRELGPKSTIRFDSPDRASADSLKSLAYA